MEEQETPALTEEQQHRARMAADPRGRAATMIDVILRSASQDELEEFCALIKPTFSGMTERL